jgi:hypothetical protein
MSLSDSGLGRDIGEGVLASKMDTVGEFGHIIHYPSRAKVEMRVCAGRTPLQWSVSR